MLPPCPENYYADGTHELAIVNLDRAFGLEGLKILDKTDLYVERGRTFLDMQEFGKAEAEFSRALDLLSHHLEAAIGRASARRHLGDPRGSLSDIEFALAIAPESAEAFLERGLLRK